MYVCIYGVHYVKQIHMCSHRIWRQWIHTYTYIYVEKQPKSRGNYAKTWWNGVGWLLTWKV